MIAVTASCGPLVVVRGAATPAHLLSQLGTEGEWKWLPTRLRGGVVVVGMGDLNQLTTMAETAVGVIDATFSHLETETIAGVCNFQEVPHLVLGYVYSTEPYRWTFYVNGFQKDVAAALDAVVTYFGWSRVNIVSDESLLLSPIASLLQSIPTHDYTSLDFPLHDSSSILRSVGKSMRMSGNRISVFLTSPVLSQAIISAQYVKSIGGAGFGNILPLLSSLFPADPSIPSLFTGNLIVAEEELTSVETEDQYYRAVLTLAAGLIGTDCDQYASRAALAARFPSHSRSPSFVLLNVQSGARVAVGQVISGVVTLPRQVVFLGNTTDVPQNAKSPLQISGNFGTRNVASISTTVYLYYYGGLLAVDQVNTWPNLLENFRMELFNFTAGVSVWNYDFAYVTSPRTGPS